MSSTDTRAEPTTAGTALWTVIVPVVLASMLMPLNSTMISVALPEMATSLNVDIATVNWLVTVYLIGVASLQPVAGKLGDRFGRRPVLLGGLAMFTAASVVAVFSPNLGGLIICRAAQAIAGALLMPTGMALIREAIPPARLGQVMGVLGAIIPIATAAGPPLGGVLLSVFGWEAIFLVNIPLALIALALGWYALPRVPRPGSTGRFDVGGAVLLCVLLVALTLLLDQTPGQTALVIGCAVLLAALALFLRYEHRHADPVLQPRLFTKRGFLAGSAGIMLSNFAFYITLLAIPMLLTRWEDVSETQSGLILAALTIGSSPLSVLGGRLADRVGLRQPGVLGLILMTLGLVVLAFTIEDIGTWPLVAMLALIGAGVGLSMPALQLGAVNSVEQRNTGSALGVFFTLRYLGSIIGTSLLAGPLALPATGTEGFGRLFVVLALVSLAGIAVAAALPGKQTAQATDEAD